MNRQKASGITIDCLSRGWSKQLKRNTSKTIRQEGRKMVSQATKDEIEMMYEMGMSVSEIADTLELKDEMVESVLGMGDQSLES